MVKQSSTTGPTKSLAAILKTTPFLYWTLGLQMFIGMQAQKPLRMYHLAIVKEICLTYRIPNTMQLSTRAGHVILLHLESQFTTAKT